MALQLREVPLPFGMGMEQGVDDYVIQPPKLMQIWNGFFDKEGALAKRHGADIITIATIDAEHIFKHGANSKVGALSPKEGPYMISDVDSRTFKTNDTSFRPCNMDIRSSVRGTDAKFGGLFPAEAGVLQYDCAYLGDYVATIWTTDDEDNPGNNICWFQVETISTGELVLPPTEVDELLEDPRVVALGASPFTPRYFLLCGRAGTGSAPLKFATIDSAVLGSVGDIITVAAPTAGAAAPPTGSYATWDIDADPNGQYAYVIGTVGLNYSVYALDYLAVSQITTGSQANPGTYSAPQVRILLNNLSRVELAHSGGGGVYATSWNTGLTLSSTPNLVFQAPFAAVGPTDGLAIVPNDEFSIASVYLAQFDSPSGKVPGATAGADDGTVLVWQRINSSTSAQIGGTHWATNVQLCGKPRFHTGLGEVIMPVNIGEVYSKNPSWSSSGFPNINSFVTFRCGYLVSICQIDEPDGTTIEKLRCHGRFGVNEIAGTDLDAATPFDFTYHPGTFEDASGRLCFSYRLFMGRDSENYATNQVVAEVVPAGGDIRKDMYGPLTQFSGGVQGCFDGHLGAENSCHSRPRIIHIEDYNFDPMEPPYEEFVWFGVLVLTWVDHQGITHRSAPSDPYYFYGPQVGGGGVGTPQDVYYHIPPELSSPHSTFNNEWIMEYYVGMPELHGNNAYLWYKWVPRENASGDAWGLANPTALGNPAGITGTKLLYTANGELASETTPGMRDIVVTDTRMFGISMDDPRIIWYTKPFVQGRAPEFHAALTLNVSSTDGGFVALARLDEKVVAFTKDQIYYFPHEGGPDANGQGGVFGGPYLVSGATTGCVNKRSIVSGPFGILFQGRQGWYVLDRGMGLSYVGDGVEDWMNGGLKTPDRVGTMAPLEVTSATCVEQDSHVRITTKQQQFNVGETNESVNLCLVWNYELNQWSVWDTLHADDTVLVDGVWWRVGFSGNIYKENRNIYTDGQASYRLAFDTSWITFDGVEGYNRIWEIHFLGKYYSADVRVTTFYNHDDDPNSADSHTYEFLEDDLGDPEIPWRWSIIPGYQTVAAIKLRVEEVDSNANPTKVRDDKAFTLSTMRFDFGVMPGAFRQKPANRRQ